MIEETFFSRTGILLGQQTLEQLADHHILIAGLGGVGSFVAEILARVGVRHLTLLDHDVVMLSNLNRQLAALHSTLGQKKAEAMAARLRDINPVIQLTILTDFLYAAQAEALIQTGHFDFVADCIDTATCKAALVAACARQGVPVISSLGAGNRLDVTQVRVTRLSQTQRCGLARVLRTRLRKLKVSLDYPVVHSQELPRSPQQVPGQDRATNGTIAYLPAMFGVMLTGAMIQQLLSK